MPPRRHVPSPSLDCSQRSSLDPGCHQAVDTVLKQLKACSRRLQTALASHRTELQVLERLYYKGKNQHRTALFWQRVAEMRKFGERVDEVHMDDVVESLRLSFWGEASIRTTKILKGPWTNYPDAKPLLFVLERCNACCMLIDRAQEHLLRAYESFTLMMQTGAFLQLVLVLAAIASRMRLLLSEIKAPLEVSWSASYAALKTLHPSSVQNVKRLPENNVVPPIAAPSASTSRAGTKFPTPNETLEEDLGHTLARVTPTPKQEDTLAVAPPIPRFNPPLFPASNKEERLDITTFSLSGELELPASYAPGLAMPTSVPAMTSVPTTAGTANAAKREKTEVEGVSAKQTKKKKKKRDEIDDIFGF